MERDSYLYKFRRKLQTIASKMIPSYVLSNFYCKLVLGHTVNITNPKTFNEKLQKYKLEYCPNNPLVVKCTDKYLVREYLKEKGLEKYLTPLLGVWDNAQDIDWDGLPNQFVLKCTHGCAYNLVCEDKKTFNRKEAIKKLNRWLKEDFSLYNVELHYKKIKPRKIICEEFLGSELIDYKFFCFSGEPRFLYVASNLINDRQARIGFFDMSGNRIPIIREDYEDLEDIDFTYKFEEMVDISKELSKSFPFVRVDFFVVKDMCKFAELTFTPSAGMMPINPRKYDEEWGSYFEWG